MNTQIDIKRSWKSTTVWTLVLGLIAWSFFNAVWTAVETGTVTVISVGWNDTAREKVAWMAGWARFAGPVIFIAGILLFKSKRISWQKVLAAFSFTLIGIVLLLFSWWFTSFGRVAGFIGLLAYSVIGVFIGNRYGWLAALLFTGAVLIALLWLGKNV
jgi:hypothetical protein